MSDSLRPSGLQPSRLLCPWDSSGKNTGVGSPSPSPGDLPDPGIKPMSLKFPVLTDSLLPRRHLGSPKVLRRAQIAKSPVMYYDFSFSTVTFIRMLFLQRQKSKLWKSQSSFFLSTQFSAQISPSWRIFCITGPKPQLLYTLPWFVGFNDTQNLPHSCTHSCLVCLFHILTVPGHRSLVCSLILLSLHL